MNARTGTPGHGKHCLCESCKAHRRRYDALRVMDNAVNGPRQLDAAPYRDIIRGHLDTGWSSSHLAVLYGCSDVAVRDIARGKTRIIRRSLAHRITRTAPSFRTAPDGVMVPAYGVQRRIQALRCLGYATDVLQPRLPVNVGSVMSVRQVHVDSHRVVAALYDELSSTWGGNPITIARARKAGYVPPAGWDDIDTDVAPPGGEPVHALDEVQWLARAGETLAGAAERLGYASAESLERGLQRWGRQDLATRMKQQGAVA